MTCYNTGMMNPKQLLEEHGFSPKKSLGQNFISDPHILEKIVTSSGVTANDVVIEVGPGTGALTEPLSQVARRVVAVELDQRLQPILEARFADKPNVSVVYEDFLTLDLETLTQGEPYIVVANVPYYITSAIIRHLLESRHQPRSLTLTVQLEVAERIVSKPGDMSLLAVSAQFYAKPQYVMRLKAGVFWPRPDVDSAVIRLDLYDQPPYDVPSPELFFRVAKAGFSQKRKQLKNSLADGLHISHEDATTLIEAAQIDPRRRPETLTLAEWAALTRQFAQRL